MTSERKGARALDAEPRTGSIYPQAFRAAAEGRIKRALGRQFGLDQFGVNLTELAPGAATALRHWHAREDEFVYVLDGEATLITEAGEESLGPGDCVGFKAGVADAHCLVNRSERPVWILEIGSRNRDDRVEYPDADLRLVPDGKGGRMFVHKDGTPY